MFSATRARFQTTAVIGSSLQIGNVKPKPTANAIAETIIPLYMPLRSFVDGSMKHGY